MEDPTVGRLVVLDRAEACRDSGWEFSAVEDIYAVRPASGNLRRVSDGTGAWRAPDWSPDGTRIACLGTRRLESDSARTEVTSIVRLRTAR